MKKSTLIYTVLIAAVGFFAFGALSTASADDGKKTIDNPATVFPAKKLNPDGTKKKNTVTFDHKKHGEENAKEKGCKTCHHKEDLKAGDDKAKSCWDSKCHTASEEMVEGKKKLDGWAIVHDKVNGRCIKCHKESGDKKAPTKCKGCHGGSDE